MGIFDYRMNVLAKVPGNVFTSFNKHSNPLKEFLKENNRAPLLHLSRVFNSTFIYVNELPCDWHRKGESRKLYLIRTTVETLTFMYLSTTDTHIPQCVTEYKMPNTRRIWNAYFKYLRFKHCPSLPRHYSLLTVHSFFKLSLLRMVAKRYKTNVWKANSLLWVMNLVSGLG